MSAPTKNEVKNFSKLIEDFAKSRQLGIMEAILEYCETSGLEPEVAAKLLTPALKKLVQADAEALNCLKKKKC